MAIWSEYQTKGIWGLWSSMLGSDLELGVEYGAFRYVFTPAGGAQRVGALPPGAVFQWESLSGLQLFLYAPSVLPDAAAEFSRVLLEYESVHEDGFPTFLPFLPGFAGLSLQLNNFIAQPPPVLVLNGQPGTGKRTVLQALAIKHAGVRIDNRDEVLFELKTPTARVILVPEVALLEIVEQQALVKHAQGGGVLWAATVYDLAALRTRKILQPAFAELLISGRFLLPALAKRDPLDLEELAAFWRAFYGAHKVDAEANLDFQKSRVLGKNVLSVESILEEGRGLRGVIAEFEKEAILKAQARVGRSQHKIANLLKVSRGSLQHKLRKYQLESYASADADTDNENEV